jgi:hypothetical protein
MGASQPHAVGEGAVGAPQVFDHYHLSLSRDAEVLPRDLRVVDHDVVAWISAHGEPIPVEHKGLTGLGALTHNQPGTVYHCFLPASFALASFALKPWTRV